MHVRPRGRAEELLCSQMRMSDFDSLAQLDMNLLVSLVVLIEARSVSKAAGTLHISQSAMSHRLSKLRALLDDPLLVVAGNELVPTPLAERLASPLREHLEAIEHAVRTRGHFEPASSQRHFRMVGPEPLQAQLLPQLMAALAERAPGLVVSLMSYFPGFVDDLEQRRVDLAILPPPSAPPGWMSTRTVFSDDFVCLFADPLLAEGWGLERYLELEHVVVTNHLSGPSPVESALAAQALERRVVARVSSFQSVPWLLQARPRLVWTVSRSIATFACRAHALVAAPVPIALPTFRLAIAWHRRDDEDPGHRWFRASVEDAAREMTATDLSAR